MGTGPKYQEKKISDAKYKKQNIKSQIPENIISLKYQELNFFE